MNGRRHRTPNALPAAFSLLELILVLAILTTLSVIAVPRFTSATVLYRAEMAARQVVMDLTYARAKALSSSQTRTVTFDTAAETITISGLPSLRKASAPYVTDLSAEPYRADVQLADFGGSSSVQFNIHGIPASAGSVVVAVGSIQKSIALDATTGKASVQ